MRLYLSSFRMGCCPDRLVELTRGGTSAVVIANAIDTYPVDRRPEGVERELHAVGELGFEATELDLRDHFGSDYSDLADELRGHDLVWVRGGDVWALRHALAASGADQVLAELLASDEIVYGGYSAGPCVLGPTQRGLETVDDPARAEALYDAGLIWDGLGVVDFCIVPHTDSPDHPESEACDALARRYRDEKFPHRRLRDGDVLVIDGDDEKTCSAPPVPAAEAADRDEEVMVRDLERADLDEIAWSGRPPTSRTSPGSSTVGVEPGNTRARRLYEHLGYEPFGERETGWERELEDGSVTWYSAVILELRKQN